MKKLLPLVAAGLCLLAGGCQEYSRSYLYALNAAQTVLARHFVVTGVDRAHGVVDASSLVNANLYTKYRTRAQARVYPLGNGLYDVEMRVTNELELSEVSALGAAQPPHDWRAVGFDHVLEAALMAEVQAQLRGTPIIATPRPSYVMFRLPPALPLRHADFFHPPIPDLAPPKPPAPPAEAPKPPAPKPPEPQAPAPKSESPAPRQNASAQLFEQYIALGDQYLRRRELDKAILEYQRASLARPDSPIGHLSLAVVWTTLGRYNAGAEALRQAASASDGQAVPAGDLRRLRALADDVSQRVLLLMGWCKKNPNDRDALLLLGYHCLLADRADEARATLQELLRTSPNDPVAQYLIRQADARRS